MNDEDKKAKVIDLRAFRKMKDVDINNTDVPFQPYTSKELDEMSEEEFDLICELGYFNVY